MGGRPFWEHPSRTGLKQRCPAGCSLSPCQGHHVLSIPSLSFSLHLRAAPTGPLGWKRPQIPSTTEELQTRAGWSRDPQDTNPAGAFHIINIYL